MIRQAYSIRDNKTGFFNDCFFNNHDEEAKRYFVTVCSNEKSGVHRFPADFDLYRLGLLDVTSGRISAADVPELIMTGIDAASISKRNSQNDH